MLLVSLTCHSPLLNNIYNIDEDSTDAVYGMLRHIYGLLVEEKWEAPPDMPDVLLRPTSRLDFLFRILHTCQ